MVEERIARVSVCLVVAAMSGASSLRADDAAWAIYVMPTVGSNVRRVAHAEGYRAHGSPRWSHDGKRLAFDASGGPGGARKFFVVNVDGSGLQELGDHAMPDWSADDKQLIFTSYGAGTKAGTWVQNLDGLGRTWMLDGICARWSADGGHIVYMDMPEKLVMTLNLEHGEERVLYDGKYERIEPGFDWSPDGKRLAVVGVNKTLQQRELVIVSENATQSKMRLSERGLEGPVTWSPNGKQLALTIDHSIYLLDVDGIEAPKVIAGQIARNSDPAWSPDGNHLAFTSDR